MYLQLKMKNINSSIASIVLFSFFLCNSGIIVLGSKTRGSRFSPQSYSTTTSEIEQMEKKRVQSQSDKQKDSIHSPNGSSSFRIDHHEVLIPSTSTEKKKGEGLHTTAKIGGREGSTSLDNQAIFNDVSGLQHGQVPNSKKRLDSTFSFVNRHSTFVKSPNGNRDSPLSGKRDLKSVSTMEDNVFTHKTLTREVLKNEEKRFDDTGLVANSRSSVHNYDRTKEIENNQVSPRKVSGRKRFSNMQMPLHAVRFISNYNYDKTAPDTLFCLKVKSLRPPAKLQIRACDSITDQSNWFYFDSNEYLRLSIDPSKCIRWQNTRLYLDNCPLAANNLKRAKFQFNRILTGIEAQKGDNSKQWMIGVDPTDRFELVRLYLRNGERDNRSCYAWEMDYASESPSLSPTSSPSATPTAKPSSTPSLL